MAVLETGVMFSGVPIVRVNYYDSSTTDSLLTAGLLEAIQLFAVEIFGDETESFKMKKYSILLHNFLLINNQKVILYCICDTIDRPKTIKNVMKNLSSDFIDMFPAVDTGNLEKYYSFEKVITKKLGDLIFRPEDRLKKVFL